MNVSNSWDNITTQQQPIKMVDTYTSTEDIGDSQLDIRINGIIDKKMKENDSNSNSFSNKSKNKMWVFFGSKVPRDQVVYLMQMLCSLIALVTSVINLSLQGEDQNRTVWIAIMSSIIGYLLPAPGMKNKNSIVI